MLYFLALFSIFFFPAFSADLHYKSSVNPTSMVLSIDIHGEELKVNLESPGVELKKFPSGHIKHLSIPFINSVWEIYFHKPEETWLKERVSLVQRFRMLDNRYYLDGRTQSFNRQGSLISDVSWSEGLLDGLCRSYDEEGNLREEKKYEKGFPVGLWKQLYANGKLASTWAFPISKALWEESQIQRVEVQPGKKGLAFVLPIQVEHIWYAEQGHMLKKMHLSVHQEGRHYKILDTGKSQSFNAQGQVVAEDDFHQMQGKKIQYMKDMGQSFRIEQVWFSKKLFNELVK